MPEQEASDAQRLRDLEAMLDAISWNPEEHLPRPPAPTFTRRLIARDEFVQCER